MGGVMQQMQKSQNQQAQFRRPSAQGMSPGQVDPLLSAGQGGKPGLLSFLSGSGQAEPPKTGNPEQDNTISLLGQILNDAGKGGF